MKHEIITYLPASHPWRGNIHHFNSIDSTNTEAKRLAEQHVPHGTVVIADSQTAGRGRLNRSFHSPAGTGIYLSVVLRPNLTPQQLMPLTCAAAVAVCDAIEKTTALRPGIKWTNDLVVKEKKLGGILTELRLNGNGLVDYAIIGIGINCEQQDGNFPAEIENIATSLLLCTGKHTNRAQLAAAMIDSLSNIAETLNNPSVFLSQYRADCITVGQEISLLRGDEIRHGKALDVDNEGALVVQFADGHLETISSGEVSIRGMYGYV